MSEKQTRQDQHKEKRDTEKNLVELERLKFRIFLKKRNNTKNIVVRPR